MIRSPFREDDTNASCGFTYNNKGRLKVRDFGGYFFGDCYDVAAYVISHEIGKPVNINDKKDFIFTLRHIEATFASVFLGHDVDLSHLENIRAAISGIAKHRTEITFSTRPYNNIDKCVWKQYGVNLNYLATNYVYPVFQYWLNKHANPYPRYTFDIKDPCYAYVIGVNSKKETLVQLYFPLRSKKDVKFITNNQSMNGLLKLTDNYDLIVICKSVKDRLSLEAYVDTMNQMQSLHKPSFTGGVKIGYVNLPSESHLLRKDEFLFLNNKLSADGRIISFMDFDATGRRAAKHMKTVYHIDYYFITNGEFGLANYGAKDFAELQAKYPAKQIDVWMNKLLQSGLIWLRDRLLTSLQQ
jgi:hypothetical protein